MIVNSWKKKLPMWATFSRIIIAPILFICLWPAIPWRFEITTGLFLVGSFTDWLDGFWARAFDAESDLGKFMDPVADKILVLGALLCLLQMNKLDIFLVFILLGRDLLIGGLRAIAASQQIIIAARPFGKWKTALQMVCVPAMFLSTAYNWGNIYQISYYGLWVTVALSLISAIEYTHGFFSQRPTSSSI